MSALLLVGFASLMMPPAEYDHPFHGKVVVRYSETHCLPNVACAGSRNGVCLIVISQRGIAAYGLEQLMKHEVAHCNGWHH